MQLHLFIESPFYTERIINKLIAIDKTDKIFVRILPKGKAVIIVGLTTIQTTLPQLTTWLKQRNIDCVYVHFMSNSIAYVLAKSGLADKPLYWILWGADFYRLSSIRDQYFMPETRSIIESKNGWNTRIRKFLGLPSEKHVLEVLDKVDFFVGYLEEFELVKDILKNEMKYLPWEYYFNVEEMNLPNISPGSGDILLGNSDDPMNNHLDLFTKVKPFLKKDQKVFIPVAGAKESYLKKLKQFVVHEEAEIIFIDRFHNSEDFFKLLESVSFVFFGHLRQQGVGTLLHLIYAGKRIFLWEANSLSKTTARWALKINLIDNLTMKDFKLLTEQEIESQRANYNQFFSVASDLDRWDDILN